MITRSTRLAALLWAATATLAATAPIAAAAQAPRLAPADRGRAPSLATPQHVLLPASAGRSLDLSVWPSPRARGVVLFNHGYGGEPAAYPRLLAAFAAAGYSVVAPLSLDSRAGPLKGQVDPKQAFATRVEDSMIARGYIAQRFKGQAVVLAGHSFGSLIAMIGGGAMTPAGALGGPPIAGVIAFSSAGSVPGLIGRDSFRRMAVPLLLVTGDADTVPGFVTDWHDHRRAFDEARPGDKTLIIVDGGQHDLVATGDARSLATVTSAAVDFLAAYAGHDKAARRRLAALRSARGITVEHR